MARTIRVFWPQRVSGWVNFNWGGVIDQQSVIHIAASEGTMDQQSLFGPLNAIERMSGEAVIGVRNVRPHGDDGGGGGVEFYLEVGWGSPLNVVTDITVFELPEQAVVVG